MTKRVAFVVMALAAAIPLYADQAPIAPSVPDPSPAPVAKPAPAAPRATPPPSLAAFFEGMVLGPDGKPVAEAVLVLSAYGEPPIAARSNADGSFRIQSRRRGPHTIRVEARGLAAQTLEKVVPGAPLRVTLARGGSIEGVVRDAGTGRPVANALVEAREGDATTGGSLWEPGVGAVTARTDAKGLFRLEGVARGRHTVTASSRGAGRASQSGVAPGARVELLMIPGPSISGRVLTPDGKPVPGAAVRAEPERYEPPRLAAADAAGRFEIAGLAAGAFRLIAYHKDWAVGVLGGVRLERGSDVEADIVLQAPARVTGRLVDGDRRPLAGLVGLQEIEGQPAPQTLGLLLRAEAGADGRFTLDHVPPGSHALAVAGHGVAPQRVEVEIGARQKTVDLGDVTLEAGVQIRGRVRDGTGAAIADAALEAVPEGPLVPGSAFLQGRTEGDGTFVLGGATASVYRLRVHAPGFAGLMRPVDAPSEGLDLVLEATGTITGLVVDGAGRPVEAFEVSAIPAGGREAMEHQPQRRRPVASEDGRFALDVTSGAYVVQVAARDHGRQMVSDVSVSAGAVTDLGRIRLAAAGGVRGTVTDASSAPVAGALVAARGSGRPMVLGDVQETTTDAAGAFDLRGLPSGTVIVIASHPDFADGSSAPVEIDPARTAETSVVLTQGGRIEGIVRSRAGAPLHELSILLRALSSGARYGPPLGARPGPDGSFVIERVPAGRVGVSLVTPTAPGSGTFTGSFKEVTVREGETARVEFAWREILLSGKVTRGGAPLPGVRLNAIAPSAYYGAGSGGAAAPAAGPQRMTAVTREDGTYEMIVTETGRVMIRAQSTAGMILPARAIEVADVVAQTVDLAYPAAGISGIVVDEETGAPLARASVSAAPVERGALQGGYGTAGPDGRFSIDVDAGAFRLRAGAEGYAAETLPVTVGETPATDVRVALSRGERLRGRVADSQGRPAPGAFVAAWRETGENMAESAVSSLDGSFEFAALRPGDYSLSAGSPLAGFGMLSSVAPASDDVVLRLRPGGHLRVRARRPDGAPVADAFVSVRRVNGTRVSFMGASGRTGPDGSVEIDAPAGAVEVEARKDAWTGRGQAAVSAGGLAAAEVTLTEGTPDP